MCDFINSLILNKFDKNSTISAEPSSWAKEYIDEAIVEELIPEWNKIGYTNDISREDVAGAVFFQFLYPLFGSVEFYYEAKKYVTIASVFGAGINVVLNYFFIKLFGFIAAAYTTLFCYIMFSVFHYFAMRIVLKKQGNRERIYDMKIILLVSIILIGAIIGITILYNNSIARWCVIGFVIILTFLMRKKIIGFVKELKDKTKEA